jgi:hypothetical protein
MRFWFGQYWGGHRSVTLVLARLLRLKVGFFYCQHMSGTLVQRGGQGCLVGCNERFTWCWMWEAMFPSEATFSQSNFNATAWACSLLPNLRFQDQVEVRHTGSVDAQFLDENLTFGRIGEPNPSVDLTLVHEFGH